VQQEGRCRGKTRERGLIFLEFTERKGRKWSVINTGGKKGNPRERESEGLFFLRQRKKNIAWRRRKKKYFLGRRGGFLFEELFGGEGITFLAAGERKRGIKRGKGSSNSRRKEKRGEKDFPKYCYQRRKADDFDTL